MKFYCQTSSSKKCQGTCFFQKTQIRDQNCSCNEEENEPVCFSGKFETAAIHLSEEENTDFTIRLQFQVSKKSVSLHFQSCINTHLGHTVPLHGKNNQGRVFCECWLPYLLLPW